MYIATNCFGLDKTAAMTKMTKFIPAVENTAATTVIQEINNKDAG